MFHPFSRKYDDGALWVRIPSWLVRAYKLHHYWSDGRIELILKNEKVSMRDQARNLKPLDTYFKANWQKKLRKERKMESINE